MLKKGNTNKTYLYCARSNSNKNQLQVEKIIIIIVKIIKIKIIIIIIKIGTFQQRLDTYVGSFLVIDRQIVAKPQASNGS